MSRPAVFSKEMVERAKQQLRSSTSIRDLRVAQSVVLCACFGLTMGQAAEAMGASRSQVGLWQRQAREGGPKPLSPRGGRRREMMPVEEEKAFLEPWAAEAATAGMVIVPPLHEALEKRLGRRVHASQVYRLLARHGWRRLAPDSVHPKADAVKQEDWKKNFRRWWPPTSPAPPPKENAPA